jgi:nucleoside-diphosphate-sugar epimerase
MRVIVLGGAGNFGARIVRALSGDPTIDLLAAGRRSFLVPGAEDVPCAVVDICALDFTQQLRALDGIAKDATRCSKPGYCANFESATNRNKMNGMAASPYVEAAMYAGL